MPMFEPHKQIRTGIKALRAESITKLKSATTSITSPVLSYQVGYGQRALSVGVKPPFDIKAVNNAYLVDSYIRQGIDKYIETVLKEGWFIQGEEEPKNYIKKRIKALELASGIDWHLIVESAVRDFVKFGNCFILQVKVPNPVPGLHLRSSTGKVVAAYFNLPAYQMEPQLDDDGNVVNWIQTVGHVSKSFPVDDVLQFTYCKDAGGIWGIPPVVSVIEDIRALRQAEENVLKLIYKHLNPLIHQQIPDLTGTGEGRQEDVDDAIKNIQTSAPDGYIVTPPGHTIKVIGAESQAIRAEGYLRMFKQRVFSGLGVSELTMGESDGITAGTAEALTAQMHNKSKTYQSLLSINITASIFNTLLTEGGYDPWNNEKDQVVLGWNEIEIERRIKEQTHSLNLWTMNAISATELRKDLHLLEDADWKDFYSHRVQIPQLVASRIGMDPLEMDDDEVKELLTPEKNKVPTKDITKTGKQAKNIVSPSNKTTGPLAKAGAPTAQKMSTDYTQLCEAIVNLIPKIRSGEVDSKYLCTLFPITNYYVETLCSLLVDDASLHSETLGYLRVNARLNNDRGNILTLLGGNK